jgi:uncharacterized protein YfcZ (UPF0381/DUF406 family)
MNNKFDFELINIDREKNEYRCIDIKDKSEDLKNYFLNIRESIIEERVSRVFRTRSETTEVFTAVKKITQNSKALNSQAVIIAKRLLNIENQTQERYKQIADIKNGSLFVCKFSLDTITNIILVKIEHTPFIDENDLKKHIGLPYKNEILKSCLFQFDDENVILSIIAHDSNGDISDYWWNKFLELEKVSSDEQNTILAFDTIDNVLVKNVKNKSPADYSLLRNTLIAYFRKNSSFVMDKMIKYVVDDYQPLNNTVNIAEIKSKIKEASNNKKLDTSFTIIPEKIKAKIRTVVKINNNIEIRINNDVEKFRSVICSEIGNDGKKYIKILADDTAFERFNY